MQAFRMWLPLLTLTALLASGCDQSVSSNPDGTAHAVATPVIPYGNPDRALLVAFGSPDGGPLRQQYALLRTQLLDLLRTEHSLPRKSALVLDFLSQHASSPFVSYLEQLAGHQMLAALLADKRTDLQTIGLYADILIKNENPDAAVILKALRRLRGTWTDGRIREAGRLTAQRAVRWSERVCSDCGHESAAKSSSNPGLERKRVELMDAAVRLNEFVGP